MEGAHEVCIFQIPPCVSLWPRTNVLDVFSKENQDCCVGELGSSINHKIRFEDINTCPEDQIWQRLSSLFDSFKFIYALWKNVFNIVCFAGHQTPTKTASLGAWHSHRYSHLDPHVTCVFSSNVDFLHPFRIKPMRPHHCSKVEVVCLWAENLSQKNLCSRRESQMPESLQQREGP